VHLSDIKKEQLNDLCFNSVAKKTNLSPSQKFYALKMTYIWIYRIFEHEGEGARVYKGELRDLVGFCFK